MDLILRLEKRAREADSAIKRLLYEGDYDYRIADDRELLLEAAKRLRRLECVDPIPVWEMRVK